MTTDTYSERVIHERLALLGRRAKAAVAAATAERLFPLYVLYSRVSQEVSGPLVLRTALDDVWGALLNRAPTSSLPPYEAALSLVPDVEDPSWIPESAFAQNSAAAVAYAWQTWVADDPQQAVWALRQSVEAADFAAQSETSAASLARSSGSLVDAALNAIEYDLALAETAIDGFGALMDASTSHESWGWQLAHRWHRTNRAEG